MIDEDALNVWHGDRLVGFLWRDHMGRLGFQYHNGWLRNGFRLSVQLPLQEAPFAPEERTAHFFFANLLPEGEARRHLLRARHLADSDFLLLREFGGDCAGALSILPVESGPTRESDYSLLSEDDLYRLVQQRGRTVYATVDELRPRLSLAGAQDKCPVLLRDGSYLLPSGAAASTHILKFQVPGFANVPIYEAFMSALARSVGLRVPETRLAQIREQRYLLVSRYDRLQESGRVVRLHQEDLYQILGPGQLDKYQAEGGPSFADCVRVVRQLSENPVPDIQDLVRWQAFNVLAGNSDGHAKNLALVQVEPGSNRWRLAPFYDLVCTRAIESVDRRLAMAVAGEYDPDRVAAGHWSALAGECALSPRFVLGQVAIVAEKLLARFDHEQEAFEVEHGRTPSLQRVRTVILKQCRSDGVAGRRM